MTTELLTATGLAVLLVYGAEIEPPRDGQPGIRVAAGYHDGSVLLEAIGYPCFSTGNTAICRAAQACIDAGLRVDFAPHRMSKGHPARIVSRKAS